MLLALAGLSSAAMAQQKTEVVEYEIIQVQDKSPILSGAIGSSLSAAVLKLLLVIMIVQEVLVSVSVLH